MTGAHHSDQALQPSFDQDVKVVVNGVPHELTIAAGVSLLDLLRERLQLTGTKKGAIRVRAARAPWTSTVGACCRA